MKSCELPGDSYSPVVPFQPGPVSAESTVMLCILCSQRGLLEVGPKASAPRSADFYHCVFLKNKIQEYLLTLNLIGWTLSYTASAREMRLVFATPMVGMKPVNLCLPELCSLACTDMPTALRNRAGGYALNIDFISSYQSFVFELVCCVSF